MKKLFALVLALTMVLALVGCGSKRLTRRPDSSAGTAESGGSAPASESGRRARLWARCVRVYGPVFPARSGSLYHRICGGAGDEAIVLYAEGDLQKMLDCVRTWSAVVWMNHHADGHQRTADLHVRGAAGGRHPRWHLWTALPPT